MACIELVGNVSKLSWFSATVSKITDFSSVVCRTVVDIENFFIVDTAGNFIVDTEGNFLVGF